MSYFSAIACGKWISAETQLEMGLYEVVVTAGYQDFSTDFGVSWAAQEGTQGPASWKLYQCFSVTVNAQRQHAFPAAVQIQLPTTQMYFKSMKEG